MKAINRMILLNIVDGDELSWKTIDEIKNDLQLHGIKLCEVDKMLKHSLKICIIQKNTTIPKAYRITAKGKKMLNSYVLHNNKP